MKKILLLAALVAVTGGVLAGATSLSAPTAEAAAVDFFLKIDGVNGSYTGGAIEVNSWSFGASNPSSVGSSGMGAGKVTISSFNFMKKVDKSSASLYQAATQGEHLANATLTVRLQGVKEPMTVKLTDVMVSSWSVGATSPTAAPMESISLNFSKIEFKYPK
ncbi:type VI secretion system tube protein Hcp [Candidatus Parcubacteria bacterium]|nr:type VI secretion system tube protein Hcp [Candidatus Parcubacteria bacterium]